MHPSRDIEQPLGALRRWTAEHGAELVQIPLSSRPRRVAEEGRVEDCQLIVSIGGDGTMLAAVRVAMADERPVLGVACGSLGALTNVEEDGVIAALDRIDAGDWRPHRLPALEVRRSEGDSFLALNDFAVVRAGQGQIRVSAVVDGTLYARFAGDGCVVSAPVGSSAYALAAGGPLIAPGTDAFLLTPLPAHGGFSPPLVIAAHLTLELEVAGGYGGARVEVDGQVTGLEVSVLRISLRPDVAVVVGFPDQESFLTGLRRRGVIRDSPRIVADEARGLTR